MTSGDNCGNGMFKLITARSAYIKENIYPRNIKPTEVIDSYDLNNLLELASAIDRDSVPNNKSRYGVIDFF